MKIPWNKSWATKMNFLTSCMTFLAPVSLHKGEKAVEGCENHPKNWDILGLAEMGWILFYPAVPGTFHNTFLDFCRADPHHQAGKIPFVPTLALPCSPGVRDLFPLEAPAPIKHN